MLLDELANIAGVTITTMENGAARVSLDSLSLVSDAMVSPLSYDDTTHQINHSSGSPTTPGGELAGFQSYLHTELPASEASLNTFAKDLADALNAQHALGYTPSGAVGGDLFTYTVGKEARSLTTA